MKVKLIVLQLRKEIGLQAIVIRDLEHRRAGSPSRLIRDEGNLVCLYIANLTNHDEVEREFFPQITRLQEQLQQKDLFNTALLRDLESERKVRIPRLTSLQKLTIGIRR